MQVAVWDTYVEKLDGNVEHFDVVVPQEVTDSSTIYAYAEAYLKEKGIAYKKVDSQNCQFCHVEEASPEIQQAIAKKGYAIVELGEISRQLPPQPSRRDLALYLRAFSETYRYADLRPYTTEQLWEKVQALMGSK